MNSTRSYHESLLEDLSDPIVASEYLNAAKEDSREMFLVALKDVAQVRQMTKVAKGAGVQRETLYRSLSSTGNPTLETFDSVLDVLGLEFLIIPKKVADKALIIPAAASQPLELVGQIKTSIDSIGEITRSAQIVPACAFEISPVVIAAEQLRMNQGMLNI